tara:strand:- start:14262 stop:14759 length:498 start_codon:yes stop_codon:yes gene_type:complete
VEGFEMGLIFEDDGVLSQLDSLINENYIYEGYNLTPVDEYDIEDNVSYDVYDNDEKLASIKISKTDGEAVDGVNDTYEYSDVYAEVDVNPELEGKSDEYDTENVKKWVLSKLSDMGYDANPVHVGDEKYDASEYKLDDDDVESVKADVEEVDDREFSLSDLEKDE